MTPLGVQGKRQEIEEQHERVDYTFCPGGTAIQTPTKGSNDQACTYRASPFKLVDCLTLPSLTPTFILIRLTPRSVHGFRKTAPRPQRIRKSPSVGQDPHSSDDIYRPGPLFPKSLSVSLYLGFLFFLFFVCLLFLFRFDLFF